MIRLSLILALLCLLAAGSQAASHYSAPYVVPPSAIHAITTPPGEQQPSLGGLETKGAAGPLLAPVVAASPAPPRSSPVVTALGKGGLSADGRSDQSALRVSVPPVVNALRPEAHSLADLVFVGVASHYSAAFSEAWVAIPQGPGWRIRVCGPGTCRELVTTDTGPTIPGRVVDLPYHAWEAICGLPASYGLCDVSVVIEGELPKPEPKEPEPWFS